MVCIAAHILCTGRLGLYFTAFNCFLGALHRRAQVVIKDIAVGFASCGCFLGAPHRSSQHLWVGSLDFVSQLSFVRGGEDFASQPSGSCSVPWIAAYILTFYFLGGLDFASQLSGGYSVLCIAAHVLCSGRLGRCFTAFRCCLGALHRRGKIMIMSVAVRFAACLDFISQFSLARGDLNFASQRAGACSMFCIAAHSLYSEWLGLCFTAFTCFLSALLAGPDSNSGCCFEIRCLQMLAWCSAS